MKNRILTILACLLMLINVFAFSACTNSDLEAKSGIGEEAIDKAFIVTDSQAFDEIFNDAVEFDVNFDSEMLIVCTFATEYLHPLNITEIELSNGILKINYSIQLIKETGSAVPPYQRWVAVKLDKLDIISAKNTLSFISVERIEESKQDSSFNATLYDDCGLWIKDKFQINNRVKGAIYLESQTGGSSNTNKIEFSTKWVIVAVKEEYKETFLNEEIKIEDFCWANLKEIEYRFWYENSSPEIGTLKVYLIEYGESQVLNAISHFNTLDFVYLAELDYVDHLD